MTKLATAPQKLINNCRKKLRSSAPKIGGKVQKYEDQKNKYIREIVIRDSSDKTG